ncbi:TIGR02281 family clan AA aspartic protease [Cognatiyoonia sp. IB215446]|uniref:retropepsin-like aspartic protease family protein n=1 Tax=Cognatiyoonia sp. IB215446 TaxID=3097355 RepID=UPI002A0B378B|nr:TIGR02281 family clan AA aspartic protease [Cognatiyoonia sp. IB215446]MDX8349777.1 TIGR02281 family clan AA aspartic protease [Cognatiyoonia sp. IB215446]
MSTDQIMQLTYLVLLGVAIGGSAIVAGRNNMGKMAQQAAIWALIFIGVIGAYGLWEDISGDVAARQTVMDDGQIAVPRSPDGHYYLTLDLNDVPIRFVVDTGASQVVLSQDDARRIGIDPDTLSYFGAAQTANGVVRTASVEIASVAIGPMQDRNVPAVVNGGAMDESLLGMTYLGLYDRIEIANGELVLTR